MCRAAQEVEEWKKRGPIERFGAWLRQNDILHEADLQAIEREVAAEVEAAVAFAEAGSWEPLEDLTRYVTLEAAK